MPTANFTFAGRKPTDQRAPRLAQDAEQLAALLAAHHAKSAEAVDVDFALQLLAAQQQLPQQQQQQQQAYATPAASPFVSYAADHELFLAEQQQQQQQQQQVPALHLGLGSMLLSAAASCGMQMGAADALDAALATW
jgi:hypothetical protein